MRQGWAKNLKIFLFSFVGLFSILVAGISIKTVFFSQARQSPPSRLVEYEGELQVLHGDNFKNKKATFEYSIITDGGERILVDFKEKPRFSGRSRIKAKGILKQGRLQVQKSDDYRILQRMKKVEGAKKTAVIMYNFRNNKTEPLNADRLKQLVFTASDSANAFFKEESYGKISLIGIQNPEGDVFGYYTIDMDSNICLLRDFAEAAKTKAAASGVPVDSYDLVIFFSPYPNCGGGGYAISDKYSLVFYSAESVGPVIKHELTHNLGTNHANSYYCKNSAGKQVAISNECTHYEYGDPYDIMGYNIFSGSTYHSNNYFKYDLEWLNNVITARRSGTYKLYPPETTTAGPRGIRLIRKRIEPYNLYQYYYLEYRRPFGFDNFKPEDPAVNGIQIRLSSQWPNTDIDSHLLYGHISSSSAETRFPMADGDVFEDLEHNIRVEQLSHSSDSATVRIDVSDIPQPDKKTPSRPTNLQASLVSTHYIEISWSPSPESDVSKYIVLRNSKSVGYTDSYYIAPKDGTPPRLYFLDSYNFESGSKQVYTVRSQDYAENTSLISQPLVVKIPPKDTVPPSVPTNLTITINYTYQGYSSITIRWDSSTDNQKVMGYIVRRTNKQTGEQITIDTREKGFYDTTYYSDYLPAGTYKYDVKAYDADLNYSGFSTPVTITF